MLDLRPATGLLAQIVQGVTEDRLDAPTPCEHMAVADLLDHVGGLSLAFATAARKDTALGNATPSADGSRLGEHWRERIPARLHDLGEAWRSPGAWTGLASAGGVEMPAEVCGLVALDEVVVHGWDIAIATDQPFRCDPGLLEAVHGFVEQAVAEHPAGSPGLFGPPVAVPDDAPLLERVIALTGRDPRWKAAH